VRFGSADCRRGGSTDLVAPAPRTSTSIV
jgi:hypothetical protein